MYATDEFLSVLPMYHALEFTGGFLLPIIAGATVTYVDQLKGAEITAAMQATGTTVMLVVPRLLKMFHDSIDNAVAASGRLRRGLFRTLGAFSDLSGRRWSAAFVRSRARKFGGRLRIWCAAGRRWIRICSTRFSGWGLTSARDMD